MSRDNIKRRLITKKQCAYCGTAVEKIEKEHVIPACLYPETREYSNINRLTIPACGNCNHGWADDEAHFRNILTVAGDKTDPKESLYWTKVLPSFDKIDGHRRLFDLFHQLVPVVVDGEDRSKIYPGNDPRILRVVRKVVRGLSYHHKISFPVPEERVWVDVLKYKIPDEFLNAMEYSDRGKSICYYRYAVLNEEDIQSAWLITFFETVSFIGIVDNFEKNTFPTLSPAKE